MEGINTVCILTLLLCLLKYSVVHGSISAFYADNDLQQTIAVSEMANKDKKEMQQEILTLLGLHHRPKPRTHGKDYSAPKFMLDIYESMRDEGENTKDIDENSTDERLQRFNVTKENIQYINHADMIMSFVNHGDNKHVLRHEKDKRFFFDFSEVTLQESITGAELRLYRQPQGTAMTSQYYHIYVYRVTQGEDPEDKMLTMESNKTISDTYEGWIDLNITNAATSWQVFPHTNLGLYIKIVNDKGKEVKLRDIGIVDRKGEQGKQGFAVAFFKIPTDLHVRRTRATRKRQRQDVTYADEAQWSYGQSPHRSNSRSCQRRRLYVSFRSLGWQDWIIAPEGYAAFYCNGDCSFPLNAHMNATNHAIVQTLVHLMDPFRIPKPCCAPTRLSAISVLYFDDNSNVILKKYRNMVVRACGCH